MVAVRIMTTQSVLSTLLVVTWSAAIFELGFSFFLDKLGSTVFILSAILLTTYVFYHLLIGKKIGRLVTGSGLAQNIQWFVGAYSAYYTLTTIWTPMIFDGAKAAATLIWYLTVYTISLIAISWVSPKKRINLFVYIGVIAFIILIIVTAYRFFGFTDDFVQSKYRLSAFRDYNVFTQAMMIAIGLIFLNIHGRELRSRHIFAYFTLGILSVCLGAGSGSRRALILYGPIFLMSPIILAFLRGKKSSQSAAMFLIAILIIISCALPSLRSFDSSYDFSNINSRTKRALGFFTGDYEDDNRIERWEKALTIYSDISYLENLFGIGARGYLNDPCFIRSDGRRDTPHNFYLAAMLEGGLIQVFLLSIVLITISLSFYSVLSIANFWVATFLLANGIIWTVSISISGESFFDNKLVYLILLILATCSYSDEEYIDE